MSELNNIIDKLMRIAQGDHDVKIWSSEASELLKAIIEMFLRQAK